MKKELRIGLVGTGSIGKTHIERINSTLQGGRVVAVADVNVEFGKSVADKYGLLHFEFGEEMIASNDIDALMVTTSDSYHEEFVMAAIKNRKYVFCEKPLAPTKEACRRIIDAEIEAGKKFTQVGFMRRFDSGYIQLKKLISEEAYGQPLMLHCAHRNYSDPAAGWKTETTIPNSLVHEMDVVRWLLGEDYSKVEVVFPKSTRNANPELKDPQIMILTTKSGVRIDVESFVNCRYGYDIKCEVVCEEGVLNLPNIPNVVIKSNAFVINPIDEDWPTRFVDAYNTEIQQWINSCLNDIVTGPTAWDGYVAAITSDSACLARDTCKVVEIDIEDCPQLYKLGEVEYETCL